MKNPWVIIGILTVVLFGGAIWYSGQSEGKNNEGIELSAHLRGNPDAGVSLVEYSDLQCPACAAFVPSVDEVLAEYGDRIRFEYKHFPLPIHRFSQQAAVAAEAAGQQGKFFEYADLLFKNQNSWAAAAVPTTAFIQYAEQLELDTELFRRHLNSSVLREKVRADLADAQELQLGSTPTFILNGVQMDPNEFKTYDGFKQQIAFAVDPAGAAERYGTSSASASDSSSPVRFGF
ncbi:MAG: thioredoxin domain-containing protein [Patescibacteria group bacterium]